MSATELTAIIVAAIGAIGAVLLQGLQMYLSYKRDMVIRQKTETVEAKISDNTNITIRGNRAATVAAEQAVVAASEARGKSEEIVETINKKLNGGVDAAITSAIEPIQKVVQEHTTKIEELNKYVHQRNHDIVNALQTNTNKIQILIDTMKGPS